MCSSRVLLAAITLTGCGAAETPVAPRSLPAATIAIEHGDSQWAHVRTYLPTPVTVRVLSDKGHPVADAVVTFRPTQDDALIDPPTTVRTDSTGRARLRWRVGWPADVQTVWAVLPSADSVAVSAFAFDSLPMHVALTYAATAAMTSTPVKIETTPVSVTVVQGHLLGGVPCRVAASAIRSGPRIRIAIQGFSGPFASMCMADYRATATLPYRGPGYYSLSLIGRDMPDTTHQVP